MNNDLKFVFKILAFYGVVLLTGILAYKITAYMLDSQELSNYGYYNINRYSQEYPEIRTDIKLALTDGVITQGEYNAIIQKIKELTSDEVYE